MKINQIAHLSEGVSEGAKPANPSKNYQRLGGNGAHVTWLVTFRDGTTKKVWADSREHVSQRLSPEDNIRGFKATKIDEQGVAEDSLEELANTSLKVKEPKNFVNTNDRKQVVYKVMKFKSGKDTYLINFTVKGAPAFGKKSNWNAVNVSFGVREEQDDYSFGDEINTDLTAKNKNQFLIYSTVINAVRKFITEYNTEIDEIIMQGAGERQAVMYQRFFQSAGKYFPGWHHNGKHSLVRDVPRQTGKKVQEQGVAEEKCPHCNGPMVSEELMNEKKDACYYKVKSRYKVWPSAYASGALVKCRKKGADSWGNGSKNESSILEGIEQADESLHDWFNKEKWVRMDTKGNIKGPCAKEPGEGKPKCLPQAKAHSLGKKGRASAAARKRREDPNPERSGKAINVNTKKD